jgi:hypothetical protein
MKILVNVWTLSWDTSEGLNCEIFATEDEWFDHFRMVIESGLPTQQSQEADAIRKRLADRDIGEAYALWQSSFKPELDSYNWDYRPIAVEIETHQMINP